MWDSTFCKPICIMLIGFAILSNSTNKQSKTPRSPSFLVPNRTVARLYSMNCFICGIGRLITALMTQLHAASTYVTAGP